MLQNGITRMLLRVTKKAERGPGEKVDLTEHT